MPPQFDDPPRVRAALIGYGHWGPNLARNLAAVSRCQLAAICDTSQERLAAAGRAHGEAKLAHDWQAVLRDPLVDAVAIATPADTHFDIALAALRAGKHVLVEKPLAGTVGETRALTAESARRRCVLMVDHTYVFSPAVRALRGLLDAGAAGDLLHFESWRTNSGPVRRDASVHWDLATHDLSILDYLRRDEPVEIAAIPRTGDARSPHAVDLRIAYKGAFAAEIHSSWISPQKRRRIVITGTAATIVYDDLESTRKIRFLEPHDRRPVPPVLDATEPLHNVVRHFVECIGAGRAPLSDGEMGTRVVRTLEAADESLRCGGLPIAIHAARACA